MFERFFKKTEKGPQKRETTEDEQLLKIVGDIEQSPELYKFLVAQLVEQSGESEETVLGWFKDVQDSASALGLAKKVDQYLGSGTFRKLSFVSKGVDAQRNVLKILSKDLRTKSFEGQAEKGLYLNIKEDYGVEWNLEKAARDILQNFFDGNNQTLDGIKTSITKTGDKVDIKISGDSDYDWRELVHLGGSTKTESDITAGGFGEGTKILSLILLRDYGAKRVRFSSRDWEVDFYIDKVPHGSYRNEEDRGLFVKKRKKNSEKGNTFELEFEGNGAEEKAKTIEQARGLFYSENNPDFKNPSFEDREVGGFSVLPKNQPQSYSYSNPKGNLYVTGQRVHCGTRDEWNNLAKASIWTWRKITLKDRDRGMVTSDELKKLVIPDIVKSMDIDQAQKSVRDFQIWYDELAYYEAGSQILEQIVDSLADSGIKMEFPKEYFAWDFSFNDGWIGQMLLEKGNIKAPGFMKKIGMISGRELFKKLQEHNRVEETSQERKKIGLLQEAARLMKLPEEDQKDVWIFSAEGEKNIIHGQYLPEFFWFAREVFNGKFFDALHTYLHEAAHKAGPHGEAKFEYALQEYIKKIQLFMHEHRDEFERIEKEWNELK